MILVVYNVNNRGQITINSSFRWNEFSNRHFQKGEIIVIFDTANPGCLFLLRFVDHYNSTTVQ